MKVWYVLPVFPTPSETFVATDVRALAALGVDVCVHALRGPRRDAEKLLRERGLAGSKVTHGCAGNVLRGVWTGFLHPICTARLVVWVLRHSGGRLAHAAKGLALLPRMLGLFEQLQRDQPDVVHLYWGHYPATFGWLVLNRAPGVVVSLSLSAYDLLSAFPGSATVARRAHLVSTWAGANVPTIAGYGLASASVHISRQGVDLEHVKGRTFAKASHHVVTAGRLVVEKGMDDVIRAFARLAAEYPDARLTILGDGPDRRRLERLATRLGLGRAVSFRGHVAHHEVFEELARAELFLFLSRYAAERLPNVVKEAMACRCLVVTTATSGMEELLEDGRHGWVVAQGAWEAAAARAIEAFAHPVRREEMVAAAQGRVLEHFDVRRLMQGMVREWERRRPVASPEPCSVRNAS
jgi:glycosyltransferase involved in cell wall biosynthesis